jgi:hypothetical protein
MLAATLAMAAVLMLAAALAVAAVLMLAAALAMAVVLMFAAAVASTPYPSIDNRRQQLLKTYSLSERIADIFDRLNNELLLHDGKL